MGVCVFGFAGLRFGSCAPPGSAVFYTNTDRARHKNEEVLTGSRRKRKRKTCPSCCVLACHMCKCINMCMHIAHVHVRVHVHLHAHVCACA